MIGPTLVHAQATGGVTVEIGLGARGKIRLSVSPMLGKDHDEGPEGHHQLHLQWLDRPGDDPSPVPSFGREHLAHARLHLRHGTVEPGWQYGGGQ